MCRGHEFILDNTILSGLASCLSVFPRNCARDTLVLHCAARAKILVSRTRINPVPHPRKCLPLPVSNESPTGDGSSRPSSFPPSLPINSTSRVCLLCPCASASAPSSFPSALLLGLRERPRCMYSRQQTETRSQAEVTATPFASSPEGYEDDRPSTGRELVRRACSL